MTFTIAPQEPAKHFEERDMATRRKRPAKDRQRSRDARADVIRGILQLEMSGASIRANTVKRERHELFVLAIRHYRTWGRALEAAGLNVETVSRRRKWNVQRIIHAIHELYSRGVALHNKSVRKTDQSLTQAARKILGSWDNALMAAGYDPASIRRQRRPWTKSELMALIQQRVAAGAPLTLNGMLPVSARYAVKRLFGSFAAGLRIAGVLRRPAKFPRWSKAVIVAAIRQRHDANQPIHCAGVIASQPRLYDAARRYWGSWNQALRAAGYDPVQVRQKPEPWTATAVLAELRRRARSGCPAPAISFIQPISLVRACITFFGSLEAAAAAARVDPAKIGFRRCAGRRCRRFHVGGQEHEHQR